MTGGGGSSCCGGHVDNLFRISYNLTENMSYTR
jgi:hypothetical protein